MSMFVTTGATCVCSFGTAPGTFTATNTPTMMLAGKTPGVITDIAGGVNMAPFAMCNSLANPAVAAATAAAMGVLSPQPCMPVITGAWTPPAGKPILLGGKPCLTMDCTAICSWGGKITFTSPGQVKAMTG